MFKFKPFIVIVSILILFSCGKTELTIVLINNTDSILENISVGIMDKTKMTNPINLSSREMKSLNIDFANTPKVDGHYVINFRHGGKLISEEFGYFTYGQPLEHKWTVTIEPNTIVFSPSCNKTY